MKNVQHFAPLYEGSILDVMCNLAFRGYKRVNEIRLSGRRWRHESDHSYFRIISLEKRIVRRARNRELLSRMS